VAALTEIRFSKGYGRCRAGMFTGLPMLPPQEMRIIVREYKYTVSTDSFF
jgi:hypothetical protein